MKNLVVVFLIVTGILTLVTSCKKDDSAEPSPVINGFSPASGQIGDIITISGKNFSTSASKNIVKFNGVTATVSAATASSLTVTIPDGATTGKVSVTVNGITVESTNEFTVILLEISGFYPMQGIPGTIVIIEGENFSAVAGETTVKFNGLDAEIKEVTSTSITVSAPENVVTGKIAVSVNGVTISSTANFTLMDNSELVNNALDATATASSTYSGYSPAYVNDGSWDIDDHKKSWTNNGAVSASNPQWVELAFDAGTKVSRVEIYTPTGHEIRDFQIQYLVDTEWVTLSSIVDNSNSNCTIYFHEVECEKIRLLATKGSTYQSTYARVTEFEVWNY